MFTYFLKRVNSRRKRVLRKYLISELSSLSRTQVELRNLASIVNSNKSHGQMTDLLTTLPSFPTAQYTHLIPSLEKNFVTTTDLLTLDGLEVAKRAHLPLLDVKGLIAHIQSRLQAELGVGAGHGTGTGSRFEDVPREGQERWGRLRRNGDKLASEPWSHVGLGDEALDNTIGGGIPTGYITEIVGESGAGKTQLLLSLLLHAQLPSPHGLSRPTLYISTEHPLPTNRLTQILRTSPFLSTQPASTHPSLAKILSIQTPDLESQDHILAYQLPVALERHNIGLVVIDSIAANYRAEKAEGKNAAALASRSAHLIKLGALLRRLARDHDCAVVVANQVADRFSAPSASAGGGSGNTAFRGGAGGPVASTQRSGATPSSQASSAPDIPPNNAFGGTAASAPAVLSLDHQQRFFTGWGASPACALASENEANLKTPSLGLTWANQIACRIALVKAPAFAHGGGGGGSAAVIGSERGSAGDARKDAGGGNREAAEWAPRSWQRWLKVAFAPWAPPTEGSQGVEFEVWEGGVRAVGKGKEV